MRACTNNVAVSHLIAQDCGLPCDEGVPRVSGLCACCLARKLLKEGNTVCPGTACIIARDRHKKHYDVWYPAQLALRKSLEAHQLSQDPPPEPEKLNQGYQLPPPLNLLHGKWDDDRMPADVPRPPPPQTWNKAYQRSQVPPPEPEKLNQGYQLPPPLNLLHGKWDDDRMPADVPRPPPPQTWNEEYQRSQVTPPPPPLGPPPGQKPRDSASSASSGSAAAPTTAPPDQQAAIIAKIDTLLQQQNDLHVKFNYLVEQLAVVMYANTAAPPPIGASDL